MKRIVFFILIISLFSCSEDEVIKKNAKKGNDEILLNDETPINDETSINDEILLKELEPLIGTWKATSVTYTSKYQHKYTDLYDDFTCIVKDQDIKVTFEGNPQNSYEEYSNKIHSSGDCKIELHLNDEHVTSIDSLNIFGIGKWDMVNNEQIRLVPTVKSGVNYKYYFIEYLTIEELSSGELIILTEERYQYMDGRFLLNGTYTMVKE